MRIKLIVVLLAILLSHVLSAQNAVMNEKEFIKQNTISFSTTIASVSDSDFKQLNFDTKVNVYGLGEANHGTKEFQVLKLKLAEYLIHEKGLTTIMLEFPYSHGLLIDDYVKGKDIEGLNILTDQKNSEYKNTDFLHFINSIRKMNELRDEQHQISLLGGDIFGKPTAARLLRNYFAKVDSSQLTIFEESRKLELKVYQMPSQSEEKVFTSLSKHSKALLKRSGNEYVERSSQADYNRAIRLAEALALKWKGNVRAKSFAANVMKALNENSESKILVMAHNVHIGMSENEVGGMLKNKLGDKYLSMGTDYEEGTFSLWNMKDRNNRFVDILYTPKFEVGFANKFSELKGEFHYISLVPARQLNGEWSRKENYITSIGMGFNADLTPVDFRRKVVLTKYFDGLFIFRKIHPIDLLE